MVTIKSQLEIILTSPKSAGFAMFGAMLFAFIWVNSPFGSSYETIHHAPMSFTVGMSYSPIVGQDLA